MNNVAETLQSKGSNRSFTARLLFNTKVLSLGSFLRQSSVLESEGEGSGFINIKHKFPNPESKNNTIS